MLDVVKADLFRYQPKPYSLKILMSGLKAQGFRYMFFRRLRDHFGSKSFAGRLANLFIRRYRYKVGFQIGEKIGPGFYIGHFGTIVVSVNASIGSNCNIAHNVTSGAAREKMQGLPKFGMKFGLGPELF